MLKIGCTYRSSIHNGGVYNGYMVVRKQIVVTPEVDQRIRNLAHQRGISQSALIVEAVIALEDPSKQIERVLAFAGAVQGAPSDLSEQVDSVLYG